MPKYRKLPVVIEAEQYDGSFASAQDLAARFGKSGVRFTSWSHRDAAGEWEFGLYALTPEGETRVMPGDYLIVGASPMVCRREEFEAAHEAK